MCISTYPEYDSYPDGVELYDMHSYLMLEKVDTNSECNITVAKIYHNVTSQSFALQSRIWVWAIFSLQKMKHCLIHNARHFYNFFLGKLALVVWEWMFIRTAAETSNII